jgi:hypothetical protein
VQPVFTERPDLPAARDRLAYRARPGRRGARGRRDLPDSPGPQAPPESRVLQVLKGRPGRRERRDGQVLPAFKEKLAQQARRELRVRPATLVRLACKVKPDQRGLLDQPARLELKGVLVSQDRPGYQETQVPRVQQDRQEQTVKSPDQPVSPDQQDPRVRLARSLARQDRLVRQG